MAIRRREALLLGAAGVAAAAAGALAGALALQSSSGAGDLLAARYPDLDGRVRPLLDWRGRVLLCNFWATWCAPCREEVPLLVSAKQKWGTLGFEVVGIGVDSADKIREFSTIYQINYPVLVADGSALELLRKLGNRGGGLPYSVILDRSGRLVQRHLGAVTAAELGRFLEPLFG
jgi:thiol-disulfide isomerase/thioredoxin